MSRDNSLDPTPYAVICPVHSYVFLKQREYDDQLAAVDTPWRCPACGQDAEWDDSCQAGTGPEDFTGPDDQAEHDQEAQAYTTGDERAPYAIEEHEQEIRRMRERHGYERRHLEATNAHLVHLLIGIHSLLHPSDIALADGRVMRFHYPASLPADEILRQLSERIREIPEKLTEIAPGIEAKVLEIRDEGTFIPALAVDINPSTEQQRYLMRRVGYPCDGVPNVILTHLTANGGPAWNDPYGWSGRTYPVAHNYIIEHWHELDDGDVIDVQFILGETAAPKRSERG